MVNDSSNLNDGLRYCTSFSKNIFTVQAFNVAKNKAEGVGQLVILEGYVERFFRIVF